MAAASLAGATPAPAGGRVPAVMVLVRRALRDARTRTIAFAYLFGIYAYVQPVGYRHAYPTLAARQVFSHSFASNAALRLFYGYPYDVATVDGYCAWRVGGTLAILAGVFGVLAAVRALRTEEDTGRTELLLAGGVSRSTLYTSALCAIAAGMMLLWLAELAGFLLGGLPAGGAAYLALATVAPAAVFVGVGALVSQFAATRRVALEMGMALVVVALLVRVVADTASGAGWLRWATPLGWSEEMRPFAGAHPLVALLPILVTVLLLYLARRLAMRRDLATGLLPARDSAEPHMRMLGSPVAQALRAERASLLAWAGGVSVFALILGVVSSSISTAAISAPVRREIAKLGAGAIDTPTGYLAFVFIFFVLALSLFVCAQVGIARREEAEQRLQTLLALPVSRRRWLAGRLAFAASAAVVLSLLAALLVWAGAAAQHVSISLPQMLEAAGNCLPAALFFLGLAALAYALAPRASVGIGYGLVTAAFVWELVGALLGAPRWLVDLTPFAHVPAVPTQAFNGAAAGAMLTIGLAGALAAIFVFSRRDLAEQ